MVVASGGGGLLLKRLLTSEEAANADEIPETRDPRVVGGGTGPLKPMRGGDAATVRIARVAGGAEMSTGLIALRGLASWDNGR
jgi:hypothetical protein